MMVRHIGSVSRFVLLIACVTFWSGTGTVAAAQEATLSVTIVIVDEERACRPKGYSNYQDEATQARQCVPLTVDDVEDWIANDALYDKIEIPPQRISVGSLLPFLSGYIEINPGNVLDPARRKSAVFLFEWSEPQNLELSFQRVSSESTIPSSRRLTFTMHGERRWIHHERADSLLPAYGVTWELAAGDEKLSLRTSGR